MARKRSARSAWINEGHGNAMGDLSPERAERPSRSQKKRDSAALQELGVELARLPLRELERLGVSKDLLEAFRDLASITSHEARRRQLQYVGRLMREEDDVQKLKDAVALFREGRRPSDVLG